MQKKEKKFEDALARLEEVVKQLEDGQLPLEESLELYAEGIQLANICNKQLETAEQRINTLMTNESGEVVLTDSQGF